MAGKMSAGLAGIGREDLEAFVGMGDTSVPGIEASDINDSDIMARTREVVTPDGLFQFVYIPEDGSDNIVSDRIDQEHKKRVTRGWIDGVKDQLVYRAQAGIRAANEAALEARLKKIQQEQLEDAAAVPETTPIPAPVRGVVRKETSPRVSSPSSDPTAYVNQQLEESKQALKVAEELQREYMREVIAARAAVAKWQALASALGAIEPVRGMDSVPVVQSPSTGRTYDSPAAESGHLILS